MKSYRVVLQLKTLKQFSIIFYLRRNRLEVSSELFLYVKRSKDIKFKSLTKRFQ